MATSESEVLEETYDLSRSPVFTASDMEKLRTKDKKEGVPLQTPWTFWIDKASNASSAAQYQANLKKIYSVSTVQDFWAVLKHIPSVEALPPRYSYHLMRDVIQPMWEDEMNKYGGTWRLKVAKKDTPTVWQELLLAAIGEQLSEGLCEGDSICGVTVAVREKDDLVQVCVIISLRLNITRLNIF
ncbi:eukaryotic translation initiation factor 4E type 3-like isoform X1 [Homalodisca vitripennis]|uniref:eukaryotic translation initiation factor 4E type 3-like isoform X1 n=1 Tax=Homalodisca vitripennis TaxID=197043 RepID=UPI001EEAB822|nr:eukaryotic translation initiation factor 4E type 3-like isoform X1 [Homalodisca vitripennis]